MARIRTIKPEFWTSAQVMECSPMARLLFIGSWNFADDAGRMAYSPKTLKAQVFPSDDIGIADIQRMIVELSSNGLILIYASGGKEFLQITGWHHQRVDRPRQSSIPGPFDDDSTNVRRDLATDLIVSYPSEKKIAADAGADAPPNPRKKLFDEGLPKLAKLTGKGPDACRSFLGKCLKEVGDDAIVVLAAIEDAERNQVIDPSAYISKVLKTRSAPVSMNVVRDWEMACKQWKSIGRWPKGHGNDPESASCVCPPEILAKHGIRHEQKASRIAPVHQGSGSP